MFSQGAKAYAQVNVETAVNTATPIQLVVLLYDGTVSALSSAKLEMTKGNIAVKARRINQAINIITELRHALRFDDEGVKSDGPDLAVSLNDLYVYMIKRICEANLHNDPKVLDEVIFLMNDLGSAWKILAKSQEQAEAASEPTPSSGISSHA